ncbi:MAG: hypothetical protein GY851_17220 [bacterium]|nr:hypothetical protein [bacterium]
MPAGVVQLFDTDGQFITEVVEWKPDPRGFICGSAHWLTNDWIVYTTPHTLVFAKIVHESTTGQPSSVTTTPVR